MTEQAITIKLTDALVSRANCPPEKTEVYFREAGGLALRVRASGAKSFYFTFTRKGKKGTHKLFIGKPSDLFKVADARKQAKMLVGDAQKVDLIERRREQRQAAIKAERERNEAAHIVTLGSLIAGPADGEDDSCPYAVARKGEQIANWKFELSYLRRNLLPEHRDTDIRSLARRAVTSAMDKLKATGRRGAADGLWKHARAFFAWCMEQGRRRKGSRAERLERDAKGRALSFDEIPAVWAAAGRMETFGALVQCCLLTGMRRGEAAHLKWSYVQSDRIVIPGEITKTGKEHKIPKTALLDKVLEAAQAYRRASSDYIFPSRTGGPVAGFNTMLPRLVRDADVARFTMHDLRRTCRTTMGRLGFSNEIQRLCVGQQADALDEAYNKDDGWEIRCNAFQAYHAHIASLVGSNVIEIDFEDRAEALAAG